MVSGIHTSPKTNQKGAYKILGILWKLKYSFSRQAINQMYVSFVRPLLEYLLIVWDECTEQDKTALESLQNVAARIVTGITRSTFIVNFYKNVVRTHLQIDDIFRKCALCISVQITL